MNRDIKKIIKLFIPEIILIIKRKLLKRAKKVKADELFDGYYQLFKKILNSKSIYGEYGCGKSTLYVLENFDIPVYSVDSSEKWIGRIKKKSKFNNLNINYVNIGKVSDDGWGRPEDFSMRDNFIEYANDIWKREFKPNIVLVDGRLRVLCFLVSLKKCNPGTKIIFDDYVSRKNYHIVEELIKPTSSNGRQCLFEVNNKNAIDMKKLDLLINKFNYILE